MFIIHNINLNNVYYNINLGIIRYLLEINYKKYNKK